MRKTGLLEIAVTPQNSFLDTYPRVARSMYAAALGDAQICATEGVQNEVKAEREGGSGRRWSWLVDAVSF